MIRGPTTNHLTHGRFYRESFRMIRVLVACHNHAHHQGHVNM